MNNQLLRKIIQLPLLLFFWFCFVSGISKNGLTAKHIPPSSGPLGISGTHHLSRPHQSQQDVGMMGKPYSQYGVEPLMAGGFQELRGCNAALFKSSFVPAIAVDMVLFYA